MEAVERRLLSCNLGKSVWLGSSAFLDPHEPIGEAFVQKAAAKLKLTPEEVRARYEALAGRFHLRLKWRAGE